MSDPVTGRGIDVRVDVSDAVANGEQLSVAVTVHLPVGAPNGIVLVGPPGGGYNRRYFDLDVDATGSYRQAAHHTAHGFVLVAVDHLGVGDRDCPRKPLDLATVGRADAAAAQRGPGGDP